MDQTDDPSRKSTGARAATVIIVMLTVYLLPLLAVVTDELLLGTFWLSRNFPDGSRDVFFRAYPFLAPFFK